MAGILSTLIMSFRKQPDYFMTSTDQTQGKGRVHKTSVSKQIYICWQPPPISIIKINWDAGLDKANGQVGL
jgi:hypothetical protein